MGYIKTHKILTIVGLFFFLLLIVYSVLAAFTPVKKTKAYGITFSAFYAERFGIDWKEAYTAILDDLGARNIRLSAYWNEVEPIENVFDFSNLDWQIQEAERRNARIILAIGKKLPRWPECHVPEWIEELAPEDRHEKLLHYIAEVVLRYKDSSAITLWQIENEPFLPFGECIHTTEEELENELALVRGLDSRPILLSGSGEFSLWTKELRRADVFGSTMYRTVWDDRLKRHITYPFPASWYRAKQTLARLFGGNKPMLVIELQGESWNKKMTYELPVEAQYISMNPEQFQAVLSYASHTGFDTFYLWGVEWWYWLKTTQNDPRMWDIAKTALSSVR
ncbi:MAG: hypothetical protein COU47_02775 [Candidatus Niyogibacteria bacterium CG10_big_fil_rev_8_21_14_0_10_46_36]|uniref:Glycoside hydrolase family 42 N-terminal domain-containing protein n=1 Tax=Candidatus Niyogibacteria bacterium CG10_big_fil_rev_8_21_14_0_10_46_36 TaxID=1974726 RepID=A0A2H0TD39_9BACT|nr:MAG: hypothetical protein COU47_02775 [Candidatus Niyogibacteria bacterium CG10_big_fil_rev_8_21_14_0_10_46_36]